MASISTLVSASPSVFSTTSVRLIFLLYTTYFCHRYKNNWIHFVIRGQSNLSPYQLWIQGMTLLRRDEAAKSGVIDGAFGIDWNGPIVTQVQEQVSVPVTHHCPIQDEELEQLRTLVNNVMIMVLFLCCSNGICAK